MTIKDFFAACQAKAIAEGSYQTIIFTAKEYPVLFFSLFFKHLHAEYALATKKMIFQDQSLAQMQATLETTFLGQKELFWLGNISELDDTKLKKELFALVASYQGPHTLFIFVQADDIGLCKKNTHIIALDEMIESEKKILITHLCAQQYHVQLYDLLKKLPTASLDLIVMLYQYVLVLGRTNTDAFKKEWLEKIVGSESSLFLLAQYFFARKSELFWKSWTILKQEYGTPFWIVFWSEQLYKAHYVIELYKQNKIVESKQISSRLPFSFLQKDWKTISVKELKQAHDFLYQGDYQAKHGNSDFFLEVFYASFLTHSF